ncbi:MAG: helix-turn-helix transcriptional regulator [Nitrospiraceae bacterium]
MLPNTVIQTQTTGADELIEQIRRQAHQWARQLAGVANRRELEGIVSRLFNEVRLFKELIDQTDEAISPADDLAIRIHHFMMVNLPRGLTLKDLAKFLGYSEKYCSELFQMHMGQSFSIYLKRLRLEEAARLLEAGHLSLAQVAQRLGFSDQFAFSHFFKRALGYSPKQFRKAATANASGLPAEPDKALLSCR